MDPQGQGTREVAGNLWLPHHRVMSAEAVYDAIRATIAEQTEQDEELSMFELIGVVELIKAELTAAAMEDDDDE